MILQITHISSVTQTLKRMLLLKYIAYILFSRLHKILNFLHQQPATIYYLILLRCSTCAIHGCHSIVSFASRQQPNLRYKLQSYRVSIDQNIYMIHTHRLYNHISTAYTYCTRWISVLYILYPCCYILIWQLITSAQNMSRFDWNFSRVHRSCSPQAMSLQTQSTPEVIALYLMMLCVAVVVGLYTFEWEEFQVIFFVQVFTENVCSKILCRTHTYLTLDIKTYPEKYTTMRGWSIGKWRRIVYFKIRNVCSFSVVFMQRTCWG